MSRSLRCQCSRGSVFVAVGQRLLTIMFALVCVFPRIMIMMHLDSLVSSMVAAKSGDNPLCPQRPQGCRGGGSLLRRVWASIREVRSIMMMALTMFLKLHRLGAG